jgi:hypothetical protein
MLKQLHKIPLVVDTENWQLCCARSDSRNRPFFQFSCVDTLSVNIVLQVKKKKGQSIPVIGREGP